MKKDEKMKPENDLIVLGWRVVMSRDTIKDLPWFPPDMGDTIMVYVNCRPEAPLCYTNSPEGLSPEGLLKVWPKKTMLESLRLIAHSTLKGDIWEYMNWQEIIKPVYEDWVMKQMIKILYNNQCQRVE